ncbi:type VI secretion system ImpA family N-terminal domain-containing protein [Chelativorans sp. AA-79]|uniref:type VI secretion system protein TssA n=1 Tax=Chelativorans sp. AA-79 TaxID=3028735 RepID=UPI0023F787DC|nr:type VI secretion system ImpA family N-terminal domain-containing protein [Chelativorans sp. AA-79]WEX10876.1 type VI secretion system ImpA family N-terminal domain-containing protein [Chelativorans sp. AA-79]
MRYDHLLQPISEDEPCGPDLDEVGDGDYLNYVLTAADRLPVRFYDRDTGAPFDRSSIDLRAETGAISALLERSRDLRLLALESRFQCLAGQAVGFSECLQAMAALLDRYWDDVHPKPFDGDYTLRQNTLSALDDRASIILPLEHAPLASDRRVGQISLRDYRVAAGQAEARAEGTAVDMGTVLDALRQESSRGTAEATHASLTAAEAALASIRAKFQGAAGYEHAPSFEGLQAVLQQMREFIETALPYLAGDTARLHAGEKEEEAAGANSAVTPAEQSGADNAAGATVISHAAATAALLAAEHYFVRNEPSSPALVLVHQARALVGQPLVTALEALLPESVDQAVISVDGRTGLQLTMPRIRHITETVAAGGYGSQDDATEAEYSAVTRQEADILIQGVEAFFRRTEPSSPIPMLLAKARTFMNRDFAGILAEMMKSESR